MKTIKGPALFLAQFAGDEAPFNSWASITKWAAATVPPVSPMPSVEIVIAVTTVQKVVSAMSAE